VKAMNKANRVARRAPVRASSVIILSLMLMVIIFLILMQNIDIFSEYFGSTIYKIIFDAALVTLVILLLVYFLLRNSSYHKELEEMVRRLEASNLLLQVLNNIQSSANATLDSVKFLQESLQTVMARLSSQGVIYMLDEETSRLKPCIFYGEDINSDNLRDYEMGEGIIGQVAQSGKAVDAEFALPQEGKRTRNFDENSGSYMALPIRTGNKVVGVLFVESARKVLTPEEATLLAAVSEVMGNSLTNSKLYDITKRALDNSRKIQAYMESFIMDLRIGVMVIDDIGTVLITNKGAQNYLQLQANEILKKNIHQVLDSSGWRGHRLLQGFQSCLTEKRGIQYSHPLEDDPSSLAMEVNIFPIFKGKDELTGAAATFTKT